MTPRAELEVTEQLVLRLLLDQHPDLADRALRYLDEGWDNAQFRLGDDLLVRVPRRALAAPLILHEQQWLGAIAPGLSLEVPVPIRRGVATDYFPWSWSVIPWLDGVPGDLVDDLDEVATASALGLFLRSLHVPAPRAAPLNPVRGVALARRQALFYDRLASLRTELDTVGIERVWREALDAQPFAGPPIWLHGDLHPANVLFDDGAPCAVIDFGDICAGDPATDVAAAWMLVSHSSMATFWHAYGARTPALEARALGWAALFAMMLLQIGLEGRRSYERVARATLGNVAHASR